MTQSKRYAAHYEQLNDQRRAEAHPAPVTLPSSAYGPNELEWSRAGEDVWVWLQWAHQPATRVPAVAKGWNDRVVVIEWADTTGGPRSVVVWRNAVTRRTTKEPPTRPPSK